MYVLSKLVGALLSPLNLVFAVGFFGLWRSRRTPAANWLTAVLAVLWFSSAEVVVRPLIARMEAIHPRQEPLAADAIVVVGGYSNPGPTPASPPEFNGGVDRVVEGLHLLQQGVAPKLLLSGASSAVIQRDEPEAARIARWLESLGVESSQLVLETRSRNTAENAMETAVLASRLGIERIVLVTSALHMPRAVLWFERAGLEVQPHPVDPMARPEPFGPRSFAPSEKWLLGMRKLWKEILGLVYYRLAGTT